MFGAVEWRMGNTCCQAVRKHFRTLIDGRVSLSMSTVSFSLFFLIVFHQPTDDV